MSAKGARREPFLVQFSKQKELVIIAMSVSPERDPDVLIIRISTREEAEMDRLLVSRVKTQVKKLCAIVNPHESGAMGRENRSARLLLDLYREKG